jgi:hypothetical protein
MTAVNFAKEFGEFNHQHVSKIYFMMIGMVDSKMEGILRGPTSMGRWVVAFPDFANRIE